MKPLAGSGFKLGFLLKLLLYSFIYGTVFINWIDLFAGPAHVPGYHLWLTAMYFLPFFVVLILKGLEDWELTLSFGLFTSLMNDTKRGLFKCHWEIKEWGWEWVNPKTTPIWLVWWTGKGVYP